MHNVKRIIISTIPRSGTVFLKELLSRAFGFAIVEAAFTGGFRPPAPEWDPYKFDRTYLSLKDGELLSAHYALDDTMREFIERPGVLPLFIYRDPRDVAVSTCLYIKYGLTHHFLHPLFSRLSESDALALMIAGGWMQNEIQEPHNGKLIYYDGVKYFCDMAYPWLQHPKVIAIRFEDLIDDPPAVLNEGLHRAGTNIDNEILQKVHEEYNFTCFSQGRAKGREDKAAHFRKGVKGDFRNYFNEVHVALAKKSIGQDLIRLGYEKDIEW